MPALTLTPTLTHPLSLTPTLTLTLTLTHSHSLSLTVPHRPSLSRTLSLTRTKCMGSLWYIYGLFLPNKSSLFEINTLYTVLECNKGCALSGAESKLEHLKTQKLENSKVEKERVSQTPATTTATTTTTTHLHAHTHNTHNALESGQRARGFVVGGCFVSVPPELIGFGITH